MNDSQYTNQYVHIAMPVQHAHIIDVRSNIPLLQTGVRSAHAVTNDAVLVEFTA